MYVENWIIIPLDYSFLKKIVILSICFQIHNLAKDPIIDGFSTYGRCLQDTFQVWTAGSSNTPIICGTNSGYHCKYKMIFGGKKLFFVNFAIIFF